MKSHLKEAIRLVNANLILVSLLAIAGVYIKGTDVSGFFIFILTIYSTLISITAYGYFLEIAILKKRAHYLTLLGRYWWIYLKIIFIIFIPATVFSLLIVNRLSATAETLSQYSLLAIISILTIYVIPYAFLNKKAFLSFGQSILFLLNYFSYSLPLVLLTLFAFLLKALVYWKMPALQGYLLPFIDSVTAKSMIIGFIQGLVLHYADLVVFTAACLVLVEKGIVKSKVMPAESDPATLS